MNNETTKDFLLDQYIDYVLTNGTPPKNVFLFMKHLDREESEFYTHFGTLDALSEYSIQQLIVKTQNTLHGDTDYSDYEPRDKLLAFYFTLVQNLKLNRTYVTSLFKHKQDLTTKLTHFKILRSTFLNFIHTIDLGNIDLPFDKLEKLYSRTQHELAWLQFLSIFKFWLSDTSSDMEKTDIFIEKNITTGFDIADSLPIQKIVDLGKFIFQEKKMM